MPSSLRLPAWEQLGAADFHKIAELAARAEEERNRYVRYYQRERSTARAHRYRNRALRAAAWLEFCLIMGDLVKTAEHAQGDIGRTLTAADVPAGIKQAAWNQAVRKIAAYVREEIPG